MFAHGLLSVLLACSRQGISPFQPEIDAFRREDQRQKPSKGQILFIGSSSFTRWKDLQSYFPTHAILNRAFGGSSLLDVSHFVDDVVTPYEPKQVVMYCGENDFAADPKLNPTVVFERFKALFGMIRTRTHDAPFVFVSMKPSPSRWSLAPKFEEANSMIKQFLTNQRSCNYVDVWSTMLDESGQPQPQIFVADRLHMNAKGYKLWAPLIERVLL